MPHARIVYRLEDAQAYLAEARTVANLDHTHIVPVHDVGSTDEFPCYVVSKYIEGADLSATLKRFADAQPRGELGGWLIPFRAAVVDCYKAIHG